MRRLRDPTSSSSLYNLALRPVDVVCPRCGAHAYVSADPAGDLPPAFRARRLTCPACLRTGEWSSRGGSSCWGTAADPFFRLPLWLTVAVRGHRLWAYNSAHVELLAEFAAAGLRERGPYGGCSRTLLETLPGWMKSRGHRDDVLAGLAVLRALGAAGPGRAR